MGIDPRLLTAVETLIAAHARDGQVPLIGVSGAQGSGKTTLARAAAARFGAAHLSLDDVYLDRATRLGMAQTVHPLFATRGPPLTHNLGLLTQVVDDLRRAGPDTVTTLPAFDKRTDDRPPFADWPRFRGRPRAILMDGWCLGATAQGPEALLRPVNALERDIDADGVWRGLVNAALDGFYRKVFDAFDAILFLKAPSFDVVLDWRCEQEAALLELSPATLPASRRAELALFIQYFERITRHMLEGGVRADLIVRLDRDRGVLGIDRPARPVP